MHDALALLAVDLKRRVPTRPGLSRAGMRELIGARFRHARLVNGFSPSEAAERLEISAVEVEDIEGGRRPPRLRTIARATSAFATSADFLLGVVHDEDQPAEDALLRRHFYETLNREVSQLTETTLPAIASLHEQAACAREVMVAADRLLACLAVGPSGALNAAADTLRTVLTNARAWLERVDRIHAAGSRPATLPPPLETR